MALLTFLLTNAIPPVGKAITPPSLSWVDYTITLFPVFIFLLVFFKTFKLLKAGNVDIKDVLLDKDTQVSLKKEETKQVEAFYSANAALLAQGGNAQNLAVLNAATPPAQNAQSSVSPNEQQSVSRLLALISGLVSVGLSCILTTLYIWNFVNNKTYIDLTSIVNVLLILGIGVVPYAFNKVTAIKL